MKRPMVKPPKTMPPNPLLCRAQDMVDTACIARPAKRLG
jgi:hypothetical protein